MRKTNETWEMDFGVNDMHSIQVIKDVSPRVSLRCNTSTETITFTAGRIERLIEVLEMAKAILEDSSSK